MLTPVDPWSLAAINLHRQLHGEVVLGRASPPAVGIMIICTSGTRHAVLATSELQTIIAPTPIDRPHEGGHVDLSISHRMRAGIGDWCPDQHCRWTFDPWVGRGSDRRRRSAGRPGPGRRDDRPECSPADLVRLWSGKAGIDPDKASVTGSIPQRRRLSPGPVAGRSVTSAQAPDRRRLDARRWPPRDACPDYR